MDPHAELSRGRWHALDEVLAEVCERTSGRLERSGPWPSACAPTRTRAEPPTDVLPRVPPWPSPRDLARAEATHAADTGGDPWLGLLRRVLRRLCAL